MSRRPIRRNHGTARGHPQQCVNRVWREFTHSHPRLRRSSANPQDSDLVHFVRDMYHFPLSWNTLHYFFEADPTTRDSGSRFGNGFLLIDGARRLRASRLTFIAACRVLVLRSRRSLFCTVAAGITASGDESGA